MDGELAKEEREGGRRTWIDEEGIVVSSVEQTEQSQRLRQMYTKEYYLLSNLSYHLLANLLERKLQTTGDHGLPICSYPGLLWRFDLLPCSRRGSLGDATHRSPRHRA